MRDKFRWSKTIRAQLTFGFGTIFATQLRQCSDWLR
jgi:hypothetical protein